MSYHLWCKFLSKSEVPSKTSKVVHEGQFCTLSCILPIFIILVILLWYVQSCWSCISSKAMSRGFVVNFWHWHSWKGGLMSHIHFMSSPTNVKSDSLCFKCDMQTEFLCFQGEAINQGLLSPENMAILSQSIWLWLIIAQWNTMPRRKDHTGGILLSNSRLDLTVYLTLFLERQAKPPLVFRAWFFQRTKLKLVWRKTTNFSCRCTSLPVLMLLMSCFKRGKLLPTDLILNVVYRAKSATILWFKQRIVLGQITRCPMSVAQFGQLTHVGCMNFCLQDHSLLVVCSKM